MKMRYEVIALLLLISAGVVYAQPLNEGLASSLSGVAGEPKISNESIGRNPASSSSFQPSSRTSVRKGNQMQSDFPHIQPLFLGHGFTIDTSKDIFTYHLMHLFIIKVTKFSPADITSMLEKGMGPEEIAEELQSRGKVQKVRGSLRFAGIAYALNITTYGNNTFEMDILNTPSSINPPKEAPETTETIGYISISLKEYEGEMVATGIITMNGHEYDVLLSSPSSKNFANR
jgi:hypothetical protein